MATYYVKNGGNDSNDGLSDGNAWAYHPWMTDYSGSVTLQPGDTVCLKCGDSWIKSSPSVHLMIAGQNGSNGNYITTTSYGTGSKPLLYINTDTNKSIIYAENKSYIKIDGLDIKHHSNIYDSQYYKCGLRLYDGNGGIPCHDWIITNCDIHQIPFNGIYAVYNSYNIIVGDIDAISTATISSYSNNIYDCGYAGVYLNGADPITEISNNCVYYNYIHDIRPTHVAAADLAYGITFNPTDQSVNPNYCYARYNYIKNIESWTGIDCHGGINMYAQDNYLYNIHLFFGFQGGTYITDPNKRFLDNVYIERNICENPSDYKFDRFYLAHLNGSISPNRARNINFKDNSYCFLADPTICTSVDQYGLKLDRVNGAYISGNKIYRGYSGSTQGAIIMTNNLDNINIYNNYIEDWAPAIGVYQDTIEGTVRIYNNIINCHDEGYESLESSTIDGNLYIYNNVIFIKNNGSSIKPIDLENQTISVGASVKIKNNIIAFNASVNKYYIYGPGVINGTFECDYNLYWNSSSSTPWSVLTVARSLSTWKGLGYDIHTPNTTNSLDPLFVNNNSGYTDFTDFRISSSSLAKYAGIDLDIGTDYAGYDWGETPSIGAYEYLSGNLYYIKDDGSDSNSGLSDILALAHHPWMSDYTGSATLIAGDTVFMKRGDSWIKSSPSDHWMTVGQSGSSGNYITTTAYGSGNKPHIGINTDSSYNVIRGDGMSYIKLDNLEVTHWSKLREVANKHGIRFGRYDTGNTSHHWIITNCDIHNVPNCGIWGTTDCYDIIIGDINATTTATPTSYSNQVYDVGYCGINLQGMDPTATYSNHYVYYNYVHDINTENDLYQDNLSYGIGVSSYPQAYGVSKYVEVKYNYISDVPTWTGIDSHSSSHHTYSDNYLYNCMVPFGCQSYIYGGSEGWAVCEYLTIERNIIEQPQDIPVKYQDATPLYDVYGIGVNGSDNPANNIIIRDNEFFFTARPTLSGYFAIWGIKLYGDCNGVLVENNKVYNGPTTDVDGALLLYGALENITIKNNFLHNYSIGVNVVIGAIDGDISMYDNIIISTGRGIGGAQADTMYGDFLIYNNVIIAGSANYGLRFDSTVIDSTASLKIKNNIIGRLTSGSLTYIRAPLTINGTFECDYNLYWNSTSSSPWIILGSSRNLSTWRSLGYDVNSPNITSSLDPQFYNANGDYSEDSDFVLNGSSPAIGEGVDLNIYTDYSGYLWEDPPSIGAYEYDSEFPFSGFEIDKTIKIWGII